MRSSLLSVVRQITSSRQSPRMSAESAGVDFVPLFDEQSSAVSRRVSVSSFQFHLSIWFEFSSSRRRSPSHQTPKLHEDGFFSEIFSPFTLNRPLTRGPPEPHIS